MLQSQRKSPTEEQENFFKAITQGSTKEALDTFEKLSDKKTFLLSRYFIGIDIHRRPICRNPIEYSSEHINEEVIDALLAEANRLEIQDEALKILEKSPNKTAYCLSKKIQKSLPLTQENPDQKEDTEKSIQHNAQFSVPSNQRSIGLNTHHYFDSDEAIVEYNLRNFCSAIEKDDTKKALTIFRKLSDANKKIFLLTYISYNHPPQKEQVVISTPKLFSRPPQKKQIVISAPAYALKYGKKEVVDVLFAEASRLKILMEVMTIEPNCQAYLSVEKQQPLQLVQESLDQKDQREDKEKSTQQSTQYSTPLDQVTRHKLESKDVKDSQQAITTTALSSVMLNTAPTTQPPLTATTALQRAEVSILQKSLDQKDQREDKEKSTQQSTQHSAPLDQVTQRKLEPTDVKDSQQTITTTAFSSVMLNTAPTTPPPLTATTVLQRTEVSILYSRQFKICFAIVGLAIVCNIPRFLSSDNLGFGK